MEPGPAVVDTDVYDPFAVVDDPYPAYRLLQDQHPAFYNAERELWVLSRFDDVEGALLDHGAFSSADGISLTERATASMLPLLLMMDPPRHDELRRLVSRAFTPRRVAELEPRVREVAAAQADALFAGGVDVDVDVMDYASAVPTIVIAELLGVPPVDHERFRRWVEASIRIDPVEVAQSSGPGLGELIVYLQGVVDERQAHRRDDLISGLIDAGVEGRELLGFTLLLLAAGFETTKNLIGNGVALLAANPDVRDVTPELVEEVLRYESPVALLARTTTRDVELHGTVIPEDSRVVLLYGAANRDERAFPDSGRFDPARRIERHLAFGHGIHYCIGAALARLEGRIALEELLRHRPQYDVASYERVQSPHIRGYATLTITNRV